MKTVLTQNLKLFPSSFCRHENLTFLFTPSLVYRAKGDDRWDLVQIHFNKFGLRKKSHSHIVLSRSLFNCVPVSMSDEVQSMNVVL